MYRKKEDSFIIILLKDNYCVEYFGLDKVKPENDIREDKDINKNKIIYFKKMVF